MPDCAQVAGKACLWRFSGEEHNGSEGLEQAGKGRELGVAELSGRRLKRRSQAGIRKASQLHFRAAQRKQKGHCLASSLKQT